MREEDFNFTVDTHLFRELGELLVGRESTALMELIKNAYDADATEVTVSGSGLLQHGGSIIIQDNGIGMTPEIFQSSFLRIAGRYKTTGARRSPRWQRRYTGAKGVGRLSADKLAERLRISSVPHKVLYGSRAPQGVEAFINWRTLEEDYQTLDKVGNGLSVTTFDLRPNDRPGTELVLSPLRRRWSRRALTGFVNEVTSSLVPKQLLLPPPFRKSPNEGLLGELQPWTRREYDPGFRVVFQGDLDSGESLFLRLVERANWLLEISARPDGVDFSIDPTPYHRSERDPDALSYRFYREHPDPTRGPFFNTRIYAREGTTGQRVSDLARFVSTNSGVRLYLEGFRVIPYGDASDDWLNLNRDYARRPREFEIPLDAGSAKLLQPISNEGFLTLGNDQYFGGVLLTAEGASFLRPVVNREGFLRDETFENLTELVRNGIDLLTRARASANRRARETSLERRRRSLEEDVSRSRGPSSEEGSEAREDESSLVAPDQPRSPADDFSDSMSLVQEQVEAARAQLPDDSPAHASLDQAEEAVGVAKDAAELREADLAWLQVLAGVGLQFAAFVHELNSLLGQAQAVRTLADRLTEDTEDMDRAAGSQIRRDLRSAVDELVQSLSRQASYLTEVVGPDARRRRRRIPLSGIADSSLRLLSSSLASQGIEVVEQFDREARTPPIFPAEVTTILTNLLTNAIKAAGNGGRIALAGGATDVGGVWLRVENTGQAVDLIDAERWFRPFESTTLDVDVVLGQGMGLGLPIIRRIVSEYHGTVRFVEPSAGFSTAVEVALPPREVRR
jgi:signal transduction histidine kinase